MNVNKKYLLIPLGIVLLFLIKLYFNNFLLAENGDTYDFFKVAYKLGHFNIDYQSKRNPFLPILLSPFQSEYYVQVGRIWINLFYFLSVGIFYKLSKIIFKKSNYNRTVSACATAVFATNLIIFENSFYILADAIFLFWNLLFLWTFEKYKLNKPIILALITAVCFYTRPEGIILLVGTCMYVAMDTIFNNSKDEKIKILLLKISKRDLRNIVTYILYTTLFLTPHFYRNYILYKNFFYSGYMQDEAGFLFNLKSLGLRLSNFIYGLGGIWFLPVLSILMLRIYKKIRINNNIFLILFVLYSALLLAWGPYIRLYSFPISLMILFLFSLIIDFNNIGKYKITYKTLSITTITLIISIFFYYIAVQKLDQTDLGYRKLGKGLSIIFSFPILVCFLIYMKKIVSFYKLLILISVFIVILNLVVFAEKFSITRYKYYTLKQATELYLSKYKNEGNLGYNSESGLETWYLKDFEHRYDYNPAKKGSLQKFANENNIKYVIVTKELGFNDKFTDYGKLKKTNSVIIQSFESPFFKGKTSLVKLLYY